MNKNISNFIFVLLGLLSIASCASTKKIEKNMNSKSYSMSYAMDSKKIEAKDSLSIRVGTVAVSSNIMAESTIVQREKGWFIPLLFVYIWKSQKKCSQGKSTIKEDIPLFLKTSLINEINRSGMISVDTLNASDYSIELSIDEMKTEGPYISSGLFYFAIYMYGYVHTDKAGPAISNLTISYKLKKGGQTIHSNSFSSESISEKNDRHYNDISILQRDFAESMVKETSDNFKNTIELIVSDLNIFFEGQNK